MPDLNDDTSCGPGDDPTDTGPSVEQMQQQLADVNALTEKVQAENAEFEQKIAALEAKLAKASTAAKAKPAQGRKVGPKLESFDPAELADLIALADSVELVALDAKHREIAGFTQALSGGAGAWRVAGNGLRLALPEGLPLSAPEGGQSAIHAWGLVLDGKPAAFAARFEPLVLGAGQMTNLGDDVIF